MSSQKPWRDEKRLRELHVEQCLSTREIGERLGCSRETVGNWIRRYNLGEEARPWTDAETLKQHREQGLSEAKIAEQLGCSQATIHNWLVRFGLDTSRVKEEYPWHDESLLRELYLERELTMAEVADELDCSREAIEEWIHRHGIETRSRNPEPPRELTNAEALRTLYQEYGNSTYAIAEMTGCAPSAVHSWLDRHDIETRSVGSQPGELHHRWKGGRDPYYGEDWTPQRRKAIERDDHHCQRCGITEEEHETQHDAGLDVHHKKPLRTFGEPEDANKLDNLVTLCRSCHNTVESKPGTRFTENA